MWFSLTSMTLWPILRHGSWAAWGHRACIIVICNTQTNALCTAKALRRNQPLCWVAIPLPSCLSPPLLSLLPPPPPTSVPYLKQQHGRQVCIHT